jgi:hypothetical protein
MYKVCINQNSPEKSIYVLPLNVCYTKYMIVLLTDEYLKRLWCVWEIFTLFIFCNKEVAMSRIRLLAFGDEDFQYIENMKNKENDKDHSNSKVRGLKQLLKQLKVYTKI